MPDVNPAGALRELLKSNDVYNLDRESTRRPYRADKVRVVRDGVVPRPVVALLPEEAARVLMDPWKYSVKDDPELARLADEGPRRRRQAGCVAGDRPPTAETPH